MVFSSHGYLSTRRGALTPLSLEMMTRQSTASEMQGVKIFRQFDKTYNPNVFHLTKCFRCAPLILKFADTVIRKNKARYEKSLVSGRHGEKGKVTFIRSDNADDQFEVIKGLVEKNPHDWAILSRNNTTLDKMESYLEVPVSRIGKSFWEALEPSNILHLFSFSDSQATSAL